MSVLGKESTEAIAAMTAYGIGQLVRNSRRFAVDEQRAWYTMNTYVIRGHRADFVTRQPLSTALVRVSLLTSWFLDHFA